MSDTATTPDAEAVGEISAIEASMFDANGARNPAYWRNDAAQARYRDLLSGQAEPVARAPASASAADEIASIEKSMFNDDGTKNKAYWNSEKAQARYLTLLESKQGNPAAAAAADEAHDDGPPEPATHPYRLPAEFAGDHVAEDFAAVLHTVGFPPEAADAIFAESFDGVDHSEQDNEDRVAGEQELRSLWGAEFDTNVASVTQFLKDSLPPGTLNVVLDARIGGKAVFNNPAFIAALVEHIKEAPKVPSTGDTARDIAALESFMGDDPEGYRRSGILPVRLRSLYAARKREGRK